MDITSANSSLVINVPNVFSTPQSIQQYAVDDAVATEAVEMAETRKGVDGFMSAGFTPFITTITIALAPDSASIPVMDAWEQQQTSARRIYPGSATLSIPSIGKIITVTNMVLKKAQLFPDLKKVLDFQHYTFDCDVVLAGPQ